jgi:methyl-accepting chemotaxis protein
MTIINNMKIGARLGLAFGVMMLLLIVVVALALRRANLVHEDVNTILNDRYKKVEQAGQIKYNVSLIHQKFRNAALEDDAAAAKKEADAIEALRNRNRELLDQLDKTIHAPRAREIFNAILASGEKDVAAQRELFANLAKGDQASAKAALRTTVADTGRAYERALSDLVEHQAKVMDEDSLQVQDHMSYMRKGLLAITAVAIILGCAAAAWVTRSITRPINQAMQVARRVADGDLSAQIEVASNDETGRLMQALKDMNDSLARIVGEVRSGSDAISTASNQIASGNLDLSSRTEHQASALQETASSMEELTSTVKQNADNASQANQLAASASEIAVKGGAVVSEVVQTMGSINESSKKIADIIGVIDSIAFQTNILALNAAVEAARAGEQGRGFAVVASEVRNLAQRSAAAAKEIKALIDDSVERVGAGARLVDQAGATMDEVVASVKRVTDIIGEITQASHEQSAGIEQVNDAITQMDDVTQQNAALVEQAAAAAQSMQDQAATLARVVGVFKLDGRHGTTTVVPSHVAPVAGTAITHLAKRTPAPSAVRLAAPSTVGKASRAIESQLPGDASQGRSVSAMVRR